MPCEHILLVIFFHSESTFFSSTISAETNRHRRREKRIGLRRALRIDEKFMEISTFCIIVTLLELKIEFKTYDLI